MEHQLQTNAFAKPKSKPLLRLSDFYAKKNDKPKTDKKENVFDLKRKFKRMQRKQKTFDETVVIPKANFSLSEKF